MTKLVEMHSISNSTLTGQGNRLTAFQDRDQVLPLASQPVCQPGNRRAVQVQAICNLSLAVSVTLSRLGNAGVLFYFGEISFQQRLQ
jgi:hypothetical protein